MAADEVKYNSDKIFEWIKLTGAKHILIHFDMDVLDPAEIIPAAGVVSDGMKTDEVIRLINDISDNFDVAGLTIAEPMPRIAIKLKNMLEKLPLLKCMELFHA